MPMGVSPTRRGLSSLLLRLARSKILMHDAGECSGPNPLVYTVAANRFTHACG